MFFSIVKWGNHTLTAWCLRKNLTDLCCSKCCNCHPPQGKLGDSQKDGGGLPGFKTTQKLPLAQLKMAAQLRCMHLYSFQFYSIIQHFCYIILHPNYFVKHLSNKTRWGVKKKLHWCHFCCDLCCISSFVTFGLKRRRETTIMLQRSQSVKWLLLFLKLLTFDKQFSSFLLVIVPTNQRASGTENTIQNIQ